MQNTRGLREADAQAHAPARAASSKLTRLATSAAVCVRVPPRGRGSDAASTAPASSASRLDWREAISTRRSSGNSSSANTLVCLYRSSSSPSCLACSFAHLRASSSGRCTSTRAMLSCVRGLSRSDSGAEANWLASVREDTSNRSSTACRRRVAASTSSSGKPCGTPRQSRATKNAQSASASARSTGASDGWKMRDSPPSNKTRSNALAAPQQMPSSACVRVGPSLTRCSTVSNAGDTNSSSSRASASRVTPTPRGGCACSSSKRRSRVSTKQTRAPMCAHTSRTARRKVPSDARSSVWAYRCPVFASVSSPTRSRSHAASTKPRSVASCACANTSELIRTHMACTDRVAAALALRVRSASSAPPRAARRAGALPFALLVLVGLVPLGLEGVLPTMLSMCASSPPQLAPAPCTPATVAGICLAA
mmetsp:Transcript_16697/g.42631  ORF Transcript_16697/g.42631 Transcript_16697/m.42631 type:complete len:424 (+) Transcript_16697:101-1372(+)